MSWWPFSSAGADAKASPAQPSPTAQSTPAAAAQQAPSAPNPDHEFYAAHPHLAPPAMSTPTSSSTSSTDASTSTPADEEFDSALPRTMSCRAAFDSAFYCSSLGGHFNDLYRYGELRACSEHWNDFWFCMRTKNSYSGPDVKTRLIQERYKGKEDAIKAKPNSEDIWRRRGPGEQVKEPFKLAETQE